MKVLVVGGGSIGKRHIRNLHLLGFDNILCLKRRMDEQFATENKVKVVCSFEEASLHNIQIVFVCTPTSLHIEAIEFAVKINAAIFMEKPLTHSYEDLSKAKNLIARHRNVFFIGFMLRYHPLVKKIKEIIDFKMLGNVYSARFEFGSWLPFWHPWEDYKMSYASRKELGGGVINTITHELDLIQYFFGTPDYVTCISKNLNKLNINVEEIAEAIFEYDDKIVSLHLDYLQKDYDRNIKILGDDGKIIWNWHENKIDLLKHKEQPQTFRPTEQFDVNQLYKDELSDFVRIIQNGEKKHLLDFDHAVANTELMLLMHESASDQRKLGILKPIK